MSRVCDGRVWAGSVWRGWRAAATILVLSAASPASAGQLPASAFQVYSAAAAGGIVPGPFALFTVPVGQILPTQMNEGFFEVGKKTAGWDLVAASQLNATLQGNIEPVVIGPGGKLYLTDGHHTFTSLLNSIYGPGNPTVYVNVIANFSNLTPEQFWAQMQSLNFLLPIDNGVPKTVNLSTGAPIPTSLQALTNDPYRGLEYAILKNKSSKLFTTASNITGAIGKATPGLDKVTGFYSDFIWANAYRSANNGLGLPFLSPGDIALATQWNLNGANVTKEPNVPGNVTVAQLPGFILPSSITINGTISDATLANGTLDGSKTGTFDQSTTFASFNGITSITNGTVTIGTPKIGFVLQLGADSGGSVTLGGANTYTGGTTIIAGKLIIAGDSSLGAAAPASYTLDPKNIAASVRANNGIIFNSLSEGAGTLQIGTAVGNGTTTFSSNRPIAVAGETATINLNGNLVTLSGQLISLGSGGVGVANTSGVADLTIDDNSNNKGVLTLTGASPNFYGNIIIGNANKPTLKVTSDASLGNTAGPSYQIGQVVLNGGTLLAGASFTSVRTISLTSKSTIDTGGFSTTWASLVDPQRGLTITNSAAGTTGAITFGSGEIGGALEISVGKGSGNGTNVTFTNGLIRDPNATLLLNAVSGSALGTTAQIISGTGSASLVNGIAPAWIITDAGGNNPYDFATHGANGYTAFTGYGTTFSGSTATSVLKISGGAALASNATTSAFAVNFQRGQTITGTGSTLAIGDGTNPAGLIMNGTNGNPLNLNMSTIAFGGSEGIIYVTGSQTSAIANTISAQITGTGGLTLSGTGMLTVKTASTQTGAIVVDSGTLNLAAADVFKSSAAGVLLTNTKNLASANLAFNQNQTFSALNSAGNNSFIVIDSTGAGGGSTTTKLTIGDSQNLNSTISSTIVQAAATVDTTAALTPAGTAVTGVITKNGAGLLDLSGMKSGTLQLVAGSTIAVNAGQMRVTASSFLNANAISISAGAELQFAEGGGSVFAGNISGLGDIRLIGGTLKLTGSNSYNGGTFVEVGSTLVLTTASVSTSTPTIVDAGGLVVFDQSTSGSYTGVIADGTQMGGPGPLLSGSFVKDDSTTGSGGNVTLNLAQTYTGFTYVEAGTLTLGTVDAIKSSFGVVLGRVGGAACNPSPCSGVTASLALGADNTIKGLTDNAGNNTTVQLNGHMLTLAPIAGSSWSYGGAIVDGTGTGNVVQAGPGTSVLTGNNTYTGTTTINGGALQVDGTIANSSGIAVNSGGTLTGAGSVGSNGVTVKAGGTFAPGTPGVPGTFMTVKGNLAFQSGAIYLVQVGSQSSTFAGVTGTASLAGNVLATFAGGPFVKQYDILRTAGLNGTRFAGLGTANAPVGFDLGLTYSNTDVFLNLTAALGNGTPLNGNQQNVATSINNFFNGGGALPTNFLNLFALSGGGLTTALSQLSGEAATGAQQASFSLMTSFLGLMLDPTVSGRSAPSGGTGAIGFAPDRSAFTPEIASAYASVMKAPMKALPMTFEQRWSVWGSAFGGGSQIDGDPRAGSNAVTARAYGGAVGADYRVAPNTVLGFALAGAGSNWSLAQSLGGGQGDAFQAGVYGTTHFGNAYLSAAFGAAEHWITTSRTALGTQLKASFEAQSFGGRLEGGYRFAVRPVIGVTPYAALQSQQFHTPAYRETDLGGGGFGLAFNSRDATDTRAEVGSRFDARTVIGATPVLFTGKLAYAHDWTDNPQLAAAFQALPGATFIVNGAPAPKDSALTSAGAEFRLRNDWSVETKFDGEFASHAQTYTGKAVLRHVW